MKRILQIIESSETGGAETIFLNLISNLVDGQYVPIVGLLSEGWLYNEVLRRGFVPHIFQTKKSFDISLICRLAKFIRKHHIHLIHSHLFDISVYCSFAGKLCGIPTVSTLHGVPDVRTNHSLSKLKFAIMNACSDRVVYVSHSLLRHFAKLKLANEAKSVVIHNGIDLDRFNQQVGSSLRHELGYAGDDIIIGSIGDIRPPKAYDLLIRAAAILTSRIDNIKFLLVGSETPLLNDLKKLCRDLGVHNKFMFLGFRSDIPNILKTIDVYVLSSTTEGFSLSTVEAMATGLPVICTRSGGPEDIITHGKDGLLVPPNDPHSLAGAIFELITNRTLATRLSHEAQKTARLFSVHSMVGQYEALYNRILPNYTWRHR